MVRKLVSATVSAALCLTVITPAMAQDYRFAGFEAPRGATATVNLRVPMGKEHRDRASYGVSFNYGRATGDADLGNRTSSRAITFADFRFSGTDLRQARLASFDLANLDETRRRMNLAEGGDNTTWIVVGLVAAGVAVCLLADCFGGDDDDEESSSN
jgi:hypothetical protein